MDKIFSNTLYTALLRLQILGIEIVLDRIFRIYHN